MEVAAVLVVIMISGNSKKYKATILVATSESRTVPCPEVRGINLPD